MLDGQTFWVHAACAWQIINISWTLLSWMGSQNLTGLNNMLKKIESTQIFDTRNQRALEIVGWSENFNPLTKSLQKVLCWLWCFFSSSSSYYYCYRYLKRKYFFDFLKKAVMWFKPQTADHEASHWTITLVRMSCWNINFNPT